MMDCGEMLYSSSFSIMPVSYTHLDVYKRQPMKLAKDEIVTLTPLHHLTIKEVAGEFLTFVFNSNFYCIYGHDLSLIHI